jgi:hypothetical protein
MRDPDQSEQVPKSICDQKPDYDGQNRFPGPSFEQISRNSRNEDEEHSDGGQSKN